MARRQATNSYTTEDGSVEITVQAMGGMDAGLLGLRLGGILGPTLAGIVAAMESDDPVAITGAMNQMFTKLTPTEFKDLVKLIMAGAQAKLGSEFADVTLAFLNETFASCPGSLFKLIYDGLKVNFQSFFKELGLSADLEAKLKKAATKAANKVTTA